MRAAGAGRGRGQLAGRTGTDRNKLGLAMTRQAARSEGRGRRTMGRGRLALDASVNGGAGRAYTQLRRGCRGRNAGGWRGEATGVAVRRRSGTLAGRQTLAADCVVQREYGRTNL